MKTDLRQSKAIVPSQYFVAGQFLGWKSGIDHQEEDWGEPGNWSTREFDSKQVKGQ